MRHIRRSALPVALSLLLFFPSAYAEELPTVDLSPAASQIEDSHPELSQSGQKNRIDATGNTDQDFDDAPTARNESPESGANKAAQPKSDDTQLDQTQSERVQSEQAQSGQTQSEQAQSGQTQSSQAQSGKRGVVSSQITTPTPAPEETEIPEPTDTPTPSTPPAQAPLVITPGAFDPTPLPKGTTRAAGATRYQTSVEISKKLFQKGATAKEVFVASGGDFPDGLAMGALAAKKGGPLLLTAPDTVPKQVIDEITRLKPKTIFIAGGTSSVSSAAEKQLKAIASTTRFAGKDRYQTAAVIAKKFGKIETAFLATGTTFPDALVASTASPKSPGGAAPVLLSNGYKLGRDAEAALKTMKPKNVFAVGGKWASSKAKIEASSKGKLVTLSGADRYETSASVAEHFWKAPDTVIYATGGVYADAMSGVTAGKAYDAPILLSNGQFRTPATADVAAKQTRALLLGGKTSLRPGVENSKQGVIAAKVTKNGTSYSFGMEWAGQSNGYYCGPAAGYMILDSLGFERSAAGTALSQGNLARDQYMKTDHYGATKWAYGRMGYGLDQWMGTDLYRQKGAPSATFLQDRVIESMKTTGRPVVADADEVRGGRHYNGHPTGSTFSHLMPIDGYDSKTKQLTLLDPASHFFSASKQKFSIDAASFAPFLREYGIYY